MKTATYASARTANAARKSLDGGLRIAFRSGAVMGLTVVGLGLLDIAIWFFALSFVYHGDNMALITITTTMLTFGMGASTQALFARVGGGIYTKAADVGADIVGKATWPAWAPTSTRVTAAASSPRQPSAPRPLP